jgi:hypothetical protein
VLAIIVCPLLDRYQSSAENPRHYKREMAGGAMNRVLYCLVLAVTLSLSGAAVRGQQSHTRG